MRNVLLVFMLVTINSSPLTAESLSQRVTSTMAMFEIKKNKDILCDTCGFISKAAKDLTYSHYVMDVIGDFVVKGCKAIKASSDRVCEQITKTFVKPMWRGFGDYIFDHDSICVYALNCVPQKTYLEADDFAKYLLLDKPPMEKVEIEQETLKIIHVSDFHVDPLYAVVKL